METSLLIKNIMLGGKPTDVYVEGNTIKRIAANIECPAIQTIDGRGMTIIPGFVNMHTHAAMTLFRGAGDDMPLMTWLNNCIWPAEAKMTEDDVYWGVKLACLEMIKTGTTTFLDMYKNFEVAADAVESMGIRAFLSKVCLDPSMQADISNDKRRIEEQHKRMNKFDQRVQFAIGPHAIYTVRDELLKWIHDYANDNNVLIHLHLSETCTEVEDCVKRTGKTPVRHLHDLGVLSPKLIIAHGIHIYEDELKMIADSGVSVVHNPASNMKLASGINFQYEEMKQLGIKLGLGTDGCASSNNLDMVEAMKLAALVGKAWRNNAEAVKASDIFHTATKGGAEILGINAGEVKEGMLADFSLVNTNTPAFTPNHNFTSNLVYAANGNCIDTLVCNGKVLMSQTKVAGEQAIMREAAERAYDLVKR